MIGLLVPLVMLPRFSSLLGAGTYTTVPLDVSDYAGASLEFWRGGLAAGTFDAWVEEASEPWEDAEVWTPLATLTTDDDTDLLSLTFSRKYLRIRIVLTGTNTGITCWAAGSLQKRIPTEENG